jgi:hypothetical protein
VQEIHADDFRIRVPTKYRVRLYNHFRDAPAYIRQLPIDWNIVKHLPDVYEIRMGEHWMSFSARRTAETPDDLLSFADALSWGRVTPPRLQEIRVADVAGRFLGDLDRGFILWFKKGECLADVRFEGKGEVSGTLAADVRNIINSIEYLPTQA